jgi:steroid 5-alpha reductase family enzyme
VEAVVAIALSLSVLIAGAWLVQQRIGNSGRVDKIWTFFPIRKSALSDRQPGPATI